MYMYIKSELDFGHAAFTGETLKKKNKIAI